MNLTKRLLNPYVTDMQAVRNWPMIVKSMGLDKKKEGKVKLDVENDIAYLKTGLDCFFFTCIHCI